MIARRLVVSLALVALVSNILVLAKPSAGSGSNPDRQAFALVSLKHQTVGALTTVSIESNAPPIYTVYRPTDRLVVVEMPGGDGSQLAPEYSVKNATVDLITVRRSAVSDSPTSRRAVTRVEIAVREEVHDRTVLNGNTLVVELSSERSAAQASHRVTPGVYVEPVPVGTRSAGSPNRTQPESGAMKAATTVHSVRYETAEGGARVVVDADGALQFKDFQLSDPWRVVVDLSGVRTTFGNKTLSANSAGVDRVRVGSPDSKVVRIVLDAKSKVAYRVTREGSRLVIAVGDATAQSPAASQTVEVQRANSTTDEQTAIPSYLIAQTGKPTAGTPSQSTKASGTAGSSRGRVAAKSTSPSSSAQKPSNSVRETITQQGASSGRSVLDLQRASGQQTYPSPAASSQVVPATTPQTRAPKPKPTAFCDAGYVGGLISFDLRAGVDLRDMLRFISQQYGVNFIIDKSVGAVPVDIRVNDIPWNEVLQSVLRANRLGALCEGEGGIIRIAALIAVREQREQERLANEARLLVVPTETKIIRLRYARVSGSLGGTGTGRSGVGSYTSGFNSPGFGSTGANKSSSGGQGGLLEIIKRRLSPRGVIEIDQRTNSIIVTDIPEYIQAAENIVAQLDKPDPQVEIEARIVIASRNFLRDLGVEMGGGAFNLDKGTAGVLQTSPLRFSPGGGVSPGGRQAGGGGSSGGADENQNQQQIGPNLIGPFADTALRAGVANTVLSLTTGAIGTGILSMALSASETKGQIRTIASPRITASNNQTAEIVNGVQIPVQTVSNNTITTTFVTAALRLEITPQIIEETGEVLMHVVAENNTVNTALANQFNNGTPGINTQSADSTVRIQDGGTTVMGGINIDNEGHTVNRTPGVSKIPLIGELFKRRTTTRNFDEILFFITPRIVRPDGWEGKRSMAPQRSSVEGTPNPTGTQRAAAQAKPADSKSDKSEKSTQSPQTASAAAKGGQ